MDHGEQQMHSAVVEKEIEWTDDSIRWSKEELVHDRHRQDEEDESAADIFRDAHCMDVFSFSLPNGACVTIHGYKSDSDQVWTSTGLTLWKASEHLCRYLTTNSERLLQKDNERILELGAGLGLVGIVASHLASKNSTVCLTDGDTNALSHLRKNVERNSSKHNTSCHQLLWGHEAATSFEKRHGGGRFDLILASDILYAPCVIDPLWETIRALLDQQNGVFVMAFATRKVKVTIHDFINAANEDFLHKCVNGNEEEGVFVYEFTWKH